MSSHIYVDRLHSALARCDELEETVIEIQQRIEQRRGRLSEHIRQLQMCLEKKTATEKKQHK